MISFTHQVLQHLGKAELMREPLPESAQKYTCMSDEAQKVIEEQRNVEAFEFLELTDRFSFSQNYDFCARREATIQSCKDGSKTELYRASQTAIGWTEGTVGHMDVLSLQDSTNQATREDIERYIQHSFLFRNSNGTTSLGKIVIIQTTVQPLNSKIESQLPILPLFLEYSFATAASPAAAIVASLEEQRQMKQLALGSTRIRVDSVMTRHINVKLTHACWCVRCCGFFFGGQR